MTTKTEALAQRLAEQQARHEAEEAELRAKHEEELAAIRAEQAVYERAVDEAMKSAARVRVAYVEDLYERFGIEPEPRVERRNKKTGEPMKTKAGEPVMVALDKDETRRIARLAEAVEAALGQVADVDEGSAPSGDEQPEDEAEGTEEDAPAEADEDQDGDHADPASTPPLSPSPTLTEDEGDQVDDTDLESEDPAAQVA